MRRGRISLAAVIAAHRAAPPPHDLHWAVMGTLLDLVREQRRLRLEAITLIAATIGGNVAAAARWALGVPSGGERRALMAWSIVIVVSALACVRLGFVARRRRSVRSAARQLTELQRRLERAVTRPWVPPPPSRPAG